ncbi:hypothetical protein CIT292_07817 [Citrobacter youngae ATCC 29220]|uniref:Uncharacterized protein n=1 Tax=Citrobacter youngae ATCC 29220 TaxID=500640 RepID=D4BBM8_9ENTR|nr:hypothetical protein CIT292_07817 [Citrobacter youngae ATCC 29220]
MRKTAKEHQKQVEKVASTAGATSKMTRNALQKQARKGAKIATAAINRNDWIAC